MVFWRVGKMCPIYEGHRSTLRRLPNASRDTDLSSFSNIVLRAICYEISDVMGRRGGTYGGR